MGSVLNIDYETWPRQRDTVGKVTTVVFHYDLKHEVPAVVRRDDAEKPFTTILELLDGTSRLVLSTECQWKAM